MKNFSIVVPVFNEVDNVFLHAFTDGRDCDPKSGKGFIKKRALILFQMGILDLFMKFQLTIEYSSIIKMKSV